MGLVLSERIILFRSTYKSLKDPLFNTGGEKTGFFNNPKPFGLSEIFHTSAR